MENMMRSLAQLLIDNAHAKFGVAPEDVELIMYPEQSTEEDARRKTLTMRHLRTMDADEETAMANASAEWDGEVDWHLTVFEILATCRPAKAQRGRDYYPNEARTLAAKVKGFFRGKGATGRIVQRTAYDVGGLPVQGDGVVRWQRTDSQPETPGDPTQTMVLTFEMTWWAPAPIE